MIGTFRDGMFSDGTFSDRMFSDGMFSDGTFSDGTFCMRTIGRGGSAEKTLKFCTSTITTVMIFLLSQSLHLKTFHGRVKT